MLFRSSNRRITNFCVRLYECVVTEAVLMFGTAPEERAAAALVSWTE